MLTALTHTHTQLWFLFFFYLPLFQFLWTVTLRLEIYILRSCLFAPNRHLMKSWEPLLYLMKNPSMQMKCWVWPSPLMLSINSWQISRSISRTALSITHAVAMWSPLTAAWSNLAFVRPLNFKTNCFRISHWADTLVTGCQLALQINSCVSDGKTTILLLLSCTQQNMQMLELWV